VPLDSSTSPGTGRWSRCFGDIDEMAQHIAAWDLEYHQLGAGAFRGEVALATATGLQVVTLRWNRALVNIGAAPPGMWSFALPLGRTGLRINGRDGAPNEAVTARGGQEFHVATAGPLDFVVASLDLGTFGRHLRTRFGLEEPRLPPILTMPGRRGTAVAAAAEALDAIGQLLPAAGPKAAARLQEKAAELLLSALAPPEAPAREPPRWPLARRIETLLRERIEDPPGIRELCEATGATERTLHLAFRDAYRMAPVAYLRRLRLNAVRRALVRVEAPSVTEAATRFGFFHFGRFAQDYARLFGEAPSATLRRALGAPGVAAGVAGTG
jgi:AraC family ethanolamine operon transcriptional activator